MANASPSTSLSHYIRRAYRKLGIEEPELFFGSRFGQHLPTLTQDRVNRILVYPGKFNPPLYGHLATLENGFHNAGADLNLVATMVVPRGRCSEHLTLSKQEPAELWRGAERHRNAYYWVFEEASDMWIDFEDTLQEDLRQHGFRLEWILLVGSYHMPPDHLHDYPRFITTDAGRSARFVGDDGAPTTLHGVTAWIRTEVDSHLLKTTAATEARRIQKAAKHMWPSTLQSAHGKGEHTIRKDDRRWFIATEMRTAGALEARLFDEMLIKQRAVRECFAKDDPLRRIRFVPRSIEKPLVVSSTRVRDILHRTPSFQVYEALAGLVLNPAYFIHLLRRNDWWRGNGVVEEKVGFDHERSGTEQTKAEQVLDEILSDIDCIVDGETRIVRITITRTSVVSFSQAGGDHHDMHQDSADDHGRAQSGGHDEGPSYNYSDATSSKESSPQATIPVEYDDATKEVNAVVARWHTQANHWRVRVMMTLLLLAVNEPKFNNNMQAQSSGNEDIPMDATVPSSQ